MAFFRKGSFEDPNFRFPKSFPDFSNVFQVSLHDGRQEIDRTIGPSLRCLNELIFVEYTNLILDSLVIDTKELRELVYV